MPPKGSKKERKAIKKQEKEREYELANQAEEPTQRKPRLGKSIKKRNPRSNFQEIVRSAITKTFKVDNQQVQKVIGIIGEANKKAVNEAKKQVSQEILINRRRNLIDLKYYVFSSYTYEKYLENLISYSKNVTSTKILTTSNQNLENSIYVNNLKIILYQIYNYFLLNSDEEISKEYYNMWNSFLRSFLFEILEKTIFIVFRFEDQEQEKIIRQIILKISFERCLERVYKNKDQKLTKENFLQILYKGTMEKISQILVKQSFISRSPKLKIQLQQVVTKLKNSWYLRKVLSLFLKARINKLRFTNKAQEQQQEQEQEPNINEANVKFHLNNIRVFFLDFPDRQVNGFTYTKDLEGNFPIFINFFNLKNLKQFQDINNLKSYLFFTFIHEAAHSMIRKVQIIKPQQRSIQVEQQQQDQQQMQRRPRKINKKAKEQQQLERDKKDCGWWFQKFVFGESIVKYAFTDFKSVQDLFNLQEDPGYLEDFDPWKHYQACKDYLLYLDDQEIERRKNQIFLRRLNTPNNPYNKNNQRHKIDLKNRSSSRIKSKQTKNKQILLQVQKNRSQVQKIKKQIQKLQRKFQSNLLKRDVDQQDTIKTKIRQLFFNEKGQSYYQLQKYQYEKMEKKRLQQQQQNKPQPNNYFRDRQRRLSKKNKIAQQVNIVQSFGLRSEQQFIELNVSTAQMKGQNKFFIPINKCLLLCD